MIQKYSLIVIILIFIANLLISQEKETFSDEQFKLSIGPLRGQPDYFEDFEWSKGFGTAIEYNNHFSKKFSWGCEIGLTYDYEYLSQIAIYFIQPTTPL
ncbi:MAG: hypothetical protein R2774_07700 [Saprospiraceae bacterium]